ncbi:hypothetical protein MES5069_30190 [Mesorhizobium escarrei]|uniref:Transposase DDE domain-containing protein n=1 Tax=Mesorhizobium escarrei TaxID=666018 RepID=A0ABN8JW79_9HYPH|nr:hypothetical protein MES5069_30190 [Mesorhizobium escarrei]
MSQSALAQCIYPECLKQLNVPMGSAYDRGLGSPRGIRIDATLLGRMHLLVVVRETRDTRRYFRGDCR